MALPVRRSNGTAHDIRQGPFAELDRLNRQLGDYLESWRQLPSLLGEGFTPPADVEESDDAFTVEIELPGVRKDDLDIEVAGRRLTVTGERKERQRVGILRRRERVVGRFHYEVVLPADVEEDGVEARLDDGVLTIRLPKPVNDRPRRIQVR
ncbi:MAG TPA: Hsp20/alpha crystallin family protein [Acidimicrobiales bacterium]|jgi:HSP20 family protein|nr:Hsp20/alpha crystallin family protein [Acidimicrobiales bacterium]